MDKQLFGQKITEVSTQSLNIAGIVHCLTQVDLDNEHVRGWLQSALFGLANSIEQLSDVLLDLEYECYKNGYFKGSVENEAKCTKKL